MNCILVINKEKNITSRDVVNIISKKFNTKKVGHSGTLDPIATGVLVIAINKYTKLINILTSSYKEYIATLKLGIQTDTLDITGNIINKKDFNVDEDTIKKVLNSFLGKSLQEVPKYSAVKIKGKKLYEYARNNIEVELPKREIDITNIELLDYKDNKITFKTTVSKGTYIRSLINDICTKLNTIGTMSKLIRTKQGEFTLEESSTLEDIKNNKYKLLTNEEVLTNLEIIDIDDNLYHLVSNGAIIDKIFKNEIACLRYQDKIIAIYKTYDKDHSKAKPNIMFI